MRRSYIADQIVSEMRKEKYFKKKERNKQCTIDKKMQCSTCKYQYICEGKDNR